MAPYFSLPHYLTQSKLTVLKFCSGNITFRHIVQTYKERFRLGCRSEKNEVIDEVVERWRNQDPPGRFVAKKTSSIGEVYWEDVGDEIGTIQL